MNLENIKNNISKEILRFSIPSIIAMVLTSLITITDGFFTGNYVGKEGLAAINLGLPIVYLYLGLGLMISVGGSVIAGIALGADKKEKYNQVFNQTMVTTLIITVLVSLILFLFFDPITSLLQVKGKVLGYFKDYYYVMLFGLTIMVINNSLGMFIRGEGNPQYFMKITVWNVVINCILDYLFVSKFHLGVFGVAIASLSSSLICLLFLLFYFIKRSKVYKFGRFAFDKVSLRDTILNGSSEFIGEMSMVITMFAYNLVIMKQIGIDGITAFTIVGYLSYIFTMILTGFGQGACPLISFTYGAKHEKLSRRIRKKTNQFVFCIGVVVIFIMLFSSNWYSTLFVQNEAVQEMVSSGIWIFMISFLFSGINTITSFYFTAIGKAKESAIISFMRGLVILLICICILPVLFKMTGVWLVAPMTEISTLLISLYFIRQNNKQIDISTKIY